jgi:RNA polymerase sigma factor (sigma-70 family)
MEETQLIEKLKENNDRAFKLLYKYYPKVRSYLIGFGATKQEVEDVYHEALYILINKLKDPEFVLTCSVNTFLFGICKNKYITLSREKKKVSSHQFDSEIEFDSNHKEDIEAAIQQDQKLQIAQKAFKQLEESCKKLLNAFYIEGKRMKQIAIEFGFTSDKVAKTQKYRCLEAAKRNYQLNANNSES